MKIIAGKHRNRVIPTLKTLDYRPSTTKFREALFSILSSGEFQDAQPLIGAKVLDLFAGTGGLSFEALSGGAERCVLVDNKIDHLKIVRDFAKLIGEENNVKAILLDVMRLPNSMEKHDLIFMDPPYHKEYANKVLDILIERQYLADKAIIAIEMEKRGKLDIPDSIDLVLEKNYGNNKLIILRYEQS